MTLDTYPEDGVFLMSPVGVICAGQGLTDPWWLICAFLKWTIDYTRALALRSRAINSACGFLDFPDSTWLLFTEGQLSLIVWRYCSHARRHVLHFLLRCMNFQTAVKSSFWAGLNCWLWTLFCQNWVCLYRVFFICRIYITYIQEKCLFVINGCVELAHAHLNDVWSLRVLSELLWTNLNLMYGWF